MTLDGLLTVITILIAAYAIMPNVARLQLKFRKRSLIAISVVCVSVVIYLEFGQPCFHQLANYCELVRLGKDDPIQPPQAAFLMVCLWLLLIAALASRTKIRARSLPVLSELVSELASEKRYAEIVALVQPYLDLLGLAANRQLFFARMHDRARDFSPDKPYFSIHEAQPDYSGVWGRLRRVRDKWISRLAILVPSRKNAEKAAEDVLRLLFQDKSFGEFVANQRPYFGVRLLSCNIFIWTEEFFDQFLTQLISHPQSALYQELQSNQNMARIGYVIPERNRILHFLFSDANHANDLSAWNPIGRYLRSQLRAQNREYIETLNSPADDFDEAKWRDPTFVGLMYFDVMVGAAEAQGVEWHMWLYYFPRIVESIISIYDDRAPEVDTDDEWPTRSAYLIYEIFKCMLKWVQAVRDLPSGSPHRTLQSAQPWHENGNIPKSAILALGLSLKKLLLAANIGERFRDYIHDIVMRGVDDISGEGFQRLFRAAAINSILNAGPLGKDPDYGRELRRSFYCLTMYCSITCVIMRKR